MLGPVLIAIAAAAAAVVLVLAVAVLRHLAHLAASVRRLEADLVPVLQGLRDDAERARHRRERVANRSEGRGSD